MGPAALSREGEGFLADLLDRGRAANTIDAYRRDLVAYERFLRARRLSVMRAGDADVASYVASLSAAGRKPSSVARALVAVRALHHWCGSDTALEVERPEPVPAERSVLSEAEAARLIESVPGGTAVSRRDRAILELLYATGARISEVMGLLLADAGEGVVRIGGRAPRVVPYGDPAAAALAEWLSPAGRAAMAGARRRTSPIDGAALFLNQQGGRLSRQWGWAVVRTAGERAGLGDRLAPHVLRHTFADHLARGGAPPAAVQQLLGGQSLVLTVEELVEGYRRWHPRAGGKAFRGPGPTY